MYEKREGYEVARILIPERRGARHTHVGPRRGGGGAVLSSWGGFKIYPVPPSAPNIRPQLPDAAESH